MRLIDADRFERVLLSMGEDNICNECCMSVIEKLDAQPSADVRENVKGKWIEVDAFLQKDKDLIKGNKRYTCSVCGASDTHATHKEVPYCWFCGADMRGGENE